MRAERPASQVMLAFPDVTTVRSLAERTIEPLARAEIGIWLVGEDGSVRTVSQTP